MSKLWLTYAWKDNESEDVDHIIAQLRNAGIEVSYDRAELLAGRRLWEQIDANIRNPEVNAWAILTTENSLSSEPCQEELAYALDRTLRERGAAFPLIGLFSGSFDASLIPSALATRLCVNLQDNDWVQQIKDALQGVRSGTKASPEPYGHALHKLENYQVLEVWPRTGTWVPFIAVVRQEEASKLINVFSRARGQLRGMTMTSAGQFSQGELFALTLDNPVNSTMTAQITLGALPTWIAFGQQGEELHVLKTR